MHPLQSHVSRRQIMRVAALASLASAIPSVALAAHRHAAVTGAVDAFVPGQTAFRSVSVDTSGLAARGLPNYAARIARESGPLVAKIFADRLAPEHSGAPRLIIKVDTIELGSEDDTGSGFFSGGSNDSISGAGVIVNARGVVLDSKPIDTSLPVLHSPADILYVENLRALNLVSTLARWVKQSV